jgi:hypothetical protein
MDSTPNPATTGDFCLEIMTSDPRFLNINEKVAKVRLVYGAKFCYVNADEPTRTMQKIIEGQGAQCCKDPGYPLHGHDRRRSRTRINREENGDRLVGD